MWKALEVRKHPLSLRMVLGEKAEGLNQDQTLNLARASLEGHSLPLLSSQMKMRVRQMIIWNRGMVWMC